jgi:transcriptional regulator with XRE-family HTH domain
MPERPYDRQAKRLGEQLRERRLALRLTQTEVGLLAGTTQTTVSKVELGKSRARFGVVTGIVEALGLELVPVNHDALPRILPGDPTPS